jgi:hypothetical protein
VGRRQPHADLLGYFIRFVRREPPNPPEQRFQVLTVNEFHRQEVMTVDLANVVDATDVGVSDLPRKADFLVEQLQPPGVIFQIAVTGRPNQATDGRLKTSHC